MTHRHTTPQEISLLIRALFEIARDDQPADLGSIAVRLHWGVGRAVRVLAEADRAGLADRTRCRLTMSGLVQAVRVRPLRRVQAA